MDDVHLIAKVNLVLFQKIMVRDELHFVGAAECALNFG